MHISIYTIQDKSYYLKLFSSLFLFTSVSIQKSTFFSLIWNEHVTIFNQWEFSTSNGWPLTIQRFFPSVTHLVIALEIFYILRSSLQRNFVLCKQQPVALNSPPENVLGLNCKRSRNWFNLTISAVKAIISLRPIQTYS